MTNIFSKFTGASRKAALVAALALLALGGYIYAQQQLPDFAKVEEHVLPVQGNVYMIVGAGGNSTVQVGKDGVLVVDTQFAPMIDKMVAEIRKLSDKPVRYIINTHVHGDHIGGNEALAKSGAIIVGGNFAGQVAADSGAAILAHENVLTRMSASPAQGQPAIPFAAFPTDTYFTDSKDVFFNGEAVQLIHPRNAHTDGDTIVFFRRSDVISAGDLFTPGGFPNADVTRGGSINGIIAALNRIIDLTVPAEKQEGGTYVIPGHGRLCDEADVVDYRDMATIIRDRFQDAIKKGMTLDQVKAAKLTRDYDPLYATNEAAIDRFVTNTYNSLAVNQAN
jgi:glyoxylase-like metal-dependent hydrolase (beta-lactamase superfamily II)